METRSSPYQRVVAEHIDETLADSNLGEVFDERRHGDVVPLVSRGPLDCRRELPSGAHERNFDLPS
ncbi:MAG: hypothetical protein VX656_08135, partial [Candidatus Latescibacterota bacterium]|nr:hypothetical protein [Candidatus Latescibacterota bacterium]